MLKRIFVYSLAFMLLFSMASLSQVNTEIYRSSDDTDGFHGRTSFSYSYYTGNTDFTLLKGGFRLDYLKGGLNTFFAGNIEYGEKDDSSYLSKGFGHLRTVKSLDDTFALEAFAQKQFDKFLYLNDRHLLGTGVRISQHLEKGEGKNSRKISFNIGIGLMYEYEKYDREDEESHTDQFRYTYLIRSTNYISMNAALNDRLKLNLVGYYQVDIEDFDDYRVLAEANIEIAIVEKLSFHINTLFRYDNEPFSDLKRDDFQLTNSLVYTF